jgi:hypothetical protein
MRGRAISCLVGLIGTGLSLTTVRAQERSAPPGAVIVRPVQVREVRVNQPAPPPLHDQRPTFGLPRPVDPAFISRPIPRPQTSVTNPRAPIRHRGRGRSFGFKPRFNVGHGVVVGSRHRPDRRRTVSRHRLQTRIRTSIRCRARVP